jgi:Zn-dependent protease with chaperone function
MGGHAFGRAAGTFLLAMALAGPAHAQRIAGERPGMSTLEGGIWAEADKAELAAKASSELNRDAQLTAYVRGVACKVFADYCGDLRVYVMDRPFFNAQVAPNGYTEVWSGLLLRASDEAELAFVLGHEGSHFAQNHSLQSFQAFKSRANTAMVFQMGLALAAGVAAAQSPNSASTINDTAGVVSDVIYLGAIGSYFSFSRDQETDADRLGFQRAIAAGYAPGSPANIWRSLMDETQSSDFEKKRKERARTNIFASHPLNAERVEAIDAMAQAAPAGGDAGRERYRAAIRPHLTAWLRDDLRRKDFGETLKVIEHLAKGGEDLGVLNFYRGEAYRLRRKDGDLVLARGAYEAAAAQADAPAETWRQLGDMLQSAGDRPAAQAAYQAYLEKAPQAQDRWLVEASLKKLTQGAGT